MLPVPSRGHERDVTSGVWPLARRATQLLTWFIIPISQGFCDAGEFTFLGK